MHDALKSNQYVKVSNNITKHPTSGILYPILISFPYLITFESALGKYMQKNSEPTACTSIGIHKGNQSKYRLIK